MHTENSEEKINSVKEHRNDDFTISLSFCDDQQSEQLSNILAIN